MPQDEIRCPRCGKSPSDERACAHLRWRPEQGGPLEFGRHVVATSPYTRRRGFSPANIPEAWWRLSESWVLERITLRLHVIEGYCFGEPADIDKLCLDIWHDVAPQPERGSLPPVARLNGVVLEDVR